MNDSGACRCIVGRDPHCPVHGTVLHAPSLRNPAAERAADEVSWAMREQRDAELLVVIQNALDTADLRVIHRETGTDKGAEALLRWLKTNRIVP